MDIIREQGNVHFKAGDYAAAIASYSRGIPSTNHGQAKVDDDHLAVLYNNRAACHLALGDRAAAAADCRACLALQPENAKALHRLAKALERDDPEAAFAICAAVALQTRIGVPPETLQLYKEIQSNFAASSQGPSLEEGRLHLQLPADRKHIFYCTSWGGVEQAGDASPCVYVLRSGAHETNGAMELPDHVLLIGLGPEPQLRSSFCHGLYIQQPGQVVTAVNFRLAGNGRGAAACVANGAHLQLVRCTIRDYPEAGVLVDGGSAVLKDCTLDRLREQAIEVRRGGVLFGNGLKVSECRQGIMAYGGARAVHLCDSTVQRMAREGMLLKGSFTNAASEMQDSAAAMGKKGSVSSTAQQVSEAAESWAKKNNTELEVTLDACTVAQCGQFGLSVDFGARLVAHRSTFRSNKLCSIFAKGSADVTVTASHFIFSGAVDKWQGNPMNQSGVHVGVNYAGVVNVIGNAFQGPDQYGVVEEMGTNASKQLIKASQVAQVAQMARAMGMWSRPATVLDNIHLPTGASLPSVDSLVERVHGVSVQTKQQTLDISHPRLHQAGLRRIARVFQGIAWGPTAYEYYAIGNTVGYNVAEGLGTDDAPANVNVLLGACGDIRNLLATAHALCGHSPRTVRFFLNDGNVSMLARNAALLHMAVELQAPVDAVLAVWANHALTAEHRGLLDRSLQQLAVAPWPAWLRAACLLEGDEGQAEATLRSAFAAWKECRLPLSAVLAQRAAVVQSAGVQANALSLTMQAFTAGIGSAAEGLRKEAAQYITTGSLALKAGAPADATNPTFLLAPDLQYNVYFSSSIFRAVKLGSGQSAWDRLKDSLSPQLETISSALRAGQCSCVLVPGDILTVMTTGVPAPIPSESEGTAPLAAVQFDFIDCSNVVDYVSLPAVLQASAPLLRRAPHARLRLESLVQFQRDAKQDANAFVQSHAGPLLGPLESLTGFQLSGSQGIPQGVRLVFGRKEAETSPLTSGFLLLQLQPWFKDLLGRKARPQGTERGDWYADAAGPTALAHFAALAAPSHAPALLRLLTQLESSEGSPPCEWETALQAAIHCSPETKPCCLTYNPQPGLSLLPHPLAALVLVLSSKRLPQGAISISEAHQIITSFYWDESKATARFLLAPDVLQLHRRWHVTLGAQLPSGEVIAVGKPRELGALSAETAPPAPWRPLPPDHPLPSGDVTLLEMAVARLGRKGPAEPTEWQSRVYGDATRGIAIDVLAPGPLPAVAHADVSVKVTEGRLRVAVVPKPTQPALAAAEYTVPLPGWSPDAPRLDTTVKLNRRIGFLAARLVPLPTATQRP